MTAQGKSGGGRGAVLGYGAESLLTPDIRGLLEPLAAYARGLRSIADHPSLDATRKEERLKAVARAFEDGDAEPQSDPAVGAARALAAQLAAAGMDVQGPWRMLQAAGQDLSKRRYADWSDWLAWCRYWAAPMGRMAVAFIGGDGGAQARAESFAIAIQLLHTAAEARSQYRWLDRIYIPERWFRDAGASPEALGENAPSLALGAVYARIGAQAEELLGSAGYPGAGMAPFRLRWALASLGIEARARARDLGRGRIARSPSGAARLRGFCQALLNR